MCGINGIYGLKSEDEAVDKIRKMNNALVHRGPNAEGVYFGNQIALGHLRLSVIDVSEASNQPMTDASGRYTLIFNGELYNYKELKKSLGDYDYKTQGDTEVFLAGLIKWGANFLKMCNGMFSIALWDNHKEELFLARDRMGIKPLYYARTESQFVFSSEIRAIIKSGLTSGGLNTDALGDYLRYQTVHGINTMVQGVYKLPQGSWMRISDDDMKMETYWNASTATEPGISRMAYDDVTALVRQKYEASVARRMISDVPIGAFLSGGIDSTALVAAASKVSTSKLKTFTVSFDNSEFSEAKYAQLVADKYDTEHHEIALSPETLLDSLPSALKAMDHPSGDGINTYVVSKAAKEAGITVALSGLGGDELFAGYPIFKQYFSLKDKYWLMTFPKFLRRAAGSGFNLIKPGVSSEKIKQVISQDYLDVEYIYQFSREVAPVDQIMKLSQYGIKGSGTVFKMVKEGLGFGTPGFDLPALSKVSYAELYTYLEAVLLRDTDQMSSAHALEVRVPFLDHELVQTVMSVSDKHKFPSTPKKLFVDAMSDYLPSEIVNRPKMGFTFPWKEWMKNELKDFCGDHILDLGNHDAFDSKMLNKRWDQFLAGNAKVTWGRIWYLVVLQSWMKENGID